MNGRQFSVLLKVYFQMSIFNVFLKMYFVKVYFLKMYFLKVGKSEWVVPMAVWGAIQAVGSELLFVITTFTFAISNALKLRLMLQGQV